MSAKLVIYDLQYPRLILRVGDLTFYQRLNHSLQTFFEVGLTTLVALSKWYVP
jgi:hypothetical protein